MMIPQKIRNQLADSHGEAAEMLHLESDRGSAIVGAAILETSLEEALSKYLIGKTKKKQNEDELLDRLDFSLKIDFAYRAGLIRKHIRDFLHCVRKIRNDFAHSPDSLSFSTDSMHDRVGNLCDLSQGFLQTTCKSLSDVPQVQLDANSTPREFLAVAGTRSAFDIVVAIQRAGLEYLNCIVEPIQELVEDELSIGKEKDGEA